MTMPLHERIGKLESAVALLVQTYGGKGWGNVTAALRAADMIEDVIEDMKRDGQPQPQPAPAIARKAYPQTAEENEAESAAELLTKPVAD